MNNTRIFDEWGRDVTHETLQPGVQYRLMYEWWPPPTKAELRHMHTEYHRRRR